MAGNQTEIKVDDAAVRKALLELHKAAGDISPALNVVGRVVRERVRLGFKMGRSPYGQAWSPLKIRQGQPLRDTGRLQESINYRVGGSGDDQYVDVGTNYGPLEGGKTVAAVHQYGAVIKPKTAKFLRFMGANGFIFAKRVVIPARPFLPIQGDQLVMPDSWNKSILAALKKHFDKVTT